MTTTQVVAEIAGQGNTDQWQSWGDIATNMAGYVAQLGEHQRGDFAELRRMDPDEPNAAIFWRAMARFDLLESGESVEHKWALILHGIALMTPTNNVSGNPQTAHDGNIPVGQALFLGEDSGRTQGFYSETRLNRLLTARGPMLRTLLARMFRMLAASGVSFNWREMAQFIMNEGYNEESAERGRRRIARDYYRAQRRSFQQSENRGETP